MYINNLKKLRELDDYTQEQISEKLKCKRSSYNNWERGIVMIPLEIADKLSLIYNVSLSYVLGIENNNSKINGKKMNYAKMLELLNKLKRDNNNTFNEISDYLKCDRSTCNRYFTGKIKIPIDRLILLSEFYNISIDSLCFKK